MAKKRSPRYPRLSLGKSVQHARQLYEGAHQSRVDVDTAAEVIGYSSSSSGAAASALGALRQYGLVDGLRGDMRISDLAMRILQPMNEEERVEALHEAANNPEAFSQVLAHFDGELPKSDSPIFAFLVRQLGFSQTGAGELVDVLRGTMSDLPEVSGGLALYKERSEGATEAREDHNRSQPAPEVSFSSSPADELITLPLGSNCRAEVRFIGEVTSTSYDRLIRHLELLKETAE